jgi:hypothetical protein
LLASPHFNPNVLGLPPSATLAFNERSDDLISQGRKVCKLGFGQSPVTTGCSSSPTKSTPTSIIMGGQPASHTTVRKVLPSRPG